MKFNRTHKQFLLAPCVAMAAIAAQAQTVENGTFNNHAEGWTFLGDYSASPSVDWYYDNHQVRVKDSPVDVGTGDNNVVNAWWLTEHPGSGVSQDISGFTVGQKYTLTFYEAAENFRDTPEPASLYWLVSLGDQTKNSIAIGSPKPGTSTDWTQVTMSFTATAATETLKFIGSAHAAVAPEPQLLLDGVSITSAVPEPAEWALALLGLGAMGFMFRGRRRG